MRYLFPFLLLVAFVSVRSFAQKAGDLDSSFANAGKLTTSGAPWHDIAVQPDGKIIAVASVLARFEVDGGLDYSFGSTGYNPVYEVGTNYVEANAVALQPDGKILVAGGAVWTKQLMDAFLLIRYRSNGYRDSSFGMDGVVLTDFGTQTEDYGYDLAVQSDGKIVVAGASDQNLALIRYNSDGSLDNTFDSDGKLIVSGIPVNFSLNRGFHAAYVKIQPDGKILTGSGGTLARLHPDGSRDSSFGTYGYANVVTPINDLAIQPDGKIVIAGGTNTFTVIRLDANGNLDNSFGNGGTVSTSQSSGSCSGGQRATSVAIQPDGRILAAGYIYCCLLGDCREFVTIRYNPNGNRDSTFGNAGTVHTTFSAFSSAESHAVGLTPDNKLVVAGHSYEIDYGAIARYHLGPALNVKNIASAAENLVVRPNPAYDVVHIEASDMENGRWYLEVTDYAGRVVLRDDLTIHNNSLKKQISLQPFADGIYFVKLSGATQKMVSKLIKTK